MNREAKFSSSEIVIKRYSTPFGALRCFFDPLLVTPSISSNSGAALDGGEQYLF